MAFAWRRREHSVNERPWRSRLPSQPPLRTSEEPGGKGLDFTNDSAPEDENADDEDTAEDDRYERSNAVGELGLQGHDGGGTDDGTEDGPHTSEEGHEHDLAGLVPVGVVQGREAEDDRLHRARQPREARRDDECQELVARHVVAERDCARLVLADGLQHLPERGVDGAKDDEET